LSAVFSVAAGSAAAQTQPFAFTVTTVPSLLEQRWNLRYEAGYGERTSEPFGLDGLAQRVRIQGALGGGFTLLAYGGLGLGNGADGSTRSSQGIELLKDLRPADRGLGLAMGLGVRREWEGVTVLLGRVSVGHAFAGSSLFGNLRFERPLERGRDGVDLITTVGWLRRLGPAFHMGVEAVGEDLEGLWEKEEAEGGAKVFVGPSVHLAPPRRSWSASLTGGPILYATRSGRSSPADRPLGATGNGYTVRASVGYSF
jgi:hypothetical protein